MITSKRIADLEMKMNANNFVAKHAREFNVAVVMTDRKKEERKGSARKMKHKGRQEW